MLLRKPGVFERRVLSLLGTFAKLRKVTFIFVVSVCLSVRLSAWNNSAPTGWIFKKFYISVFFETFERIQVSLKSDENNVRVLYMNTNIRF